MTERTDSPPLAPLAPLAPPAPRAAALQPLPCVGGPLHGELRDASADHVIWCVASGGAPGRPMIVLLHRAVLALPEVLATVVHARDAMGHYRTDASGRALRWVPREGAARE